MKTSILKFKGANRVCLPAVIWEPDERPIMVLQIIHGMTEHMGRYENFAKELTQYGIAVAGFDLRGHGKNPGNPDIASFGKDGWEDSLEDIHMFYNIINETFINIPHYMLGFSLGSFLLREYLSQYFDKLQGAIIMGTSEQPTFLMSIMMKIIEKEIKKAGFDETTDLVREMSFGNYNKQFAPNKTTADWLCSDQDELEKYLQDRLCRKDISSGLFYQLLSSMKRTTKDNYKRWNHNTPVLLISGANDPVGNNGKCVQTLSNKMSKYGMKKVEVQLYPTARHDLLHEGEQADNAIQNIINWMQKNM